MSQWHVLLSNMQLKVVGFVVIKLYKQYPDFGEIWNQVLSVHIGNSIAKKGSYLRATNYACLSACCAKLLSLNSMIMNSLANSDKTLAHIKKNFYWWRMEKDAMCHIEWYQVCHIAKSRGQNMGLYLLLLVPQAPCVCEFCCRLTHNIIRIRLGWSLIDSPKWWTLCHATRHTVPLTSWSFTFTKLCTLKV